jgi:S-adenosylmethionine:tRNA ribosyltransferase-isomerase
LRGYTGPQAAVRADIFDYELPPRLIAQHPTPNRESARLMLLPPLDGPAQDRRVSELPDLLPSGALVVVNDTRVISARLMGRKRNSGGRVELLLLERIAARPLEVSSRDCRMAEVWQAMGRATKPLRPGTEVELSAPFDENALEQAPRLVARVLGRITDDGVIEVALFTPTGEPIDAALRECGRVPLPPYIRRAPDRNDAERYQTVYAHVDGAVAAPTAGLHLTKALLDRLSDRGCDVAKVTLHVGVGTFRPVVDEDLDAHSMHSERYVVSQAAADAIARARERGAPVIAIGTTTVRALESAADPSRAGHVTPTSGQTSLLVQPGYRWLVVDGLMTNFHLPRSTLLALVCAFGGTDRVLGAYRIAMSRGYRFLSYGDAMLLWRPS